MSSATMRFTSSQVEAAKLLIEMLEADGAPVDDELRAIAEAEPIHRAETPSADTLPEAAARSAVVSHAFARALPDAPYGELLRQWPSGSYASSVPVTQGQLPLDIDVVASASGRTFSSNRQAWETLLRSYPSLASRIYASASEAAENLSLIRTLPGLSDAFAAWAEVKVPTAVNDEATRRFSELLTELNPVPALITIPSLGIAAELVAAMRGELSARDLSDEARKRLVVVETVDGVRVERIVLGTPEAEAAHRYLREHEGPEDSGEGTDPAELD